MSDRQNEDKKGLADNLLEMYADGKLVEEAAEGEVAGATEQIKGKKVMGGNWI